MSYCLHKNSLMEIYLPEVVIYNLKVEILKAMAQKQIPPLVLAEE
jgi:hypothetical protein